MFTGKLLKQIVDKFNTSPTAQNARVQVVLPNGEFYDINGAKLLQNKISCCESIERMATFGQRFY